MKEDRDPRTGKLRQGRTLKGMICKQTAKEKEECPHAIMREDGTLSCAYCPFGFVIHQKRRKSGA